LVNLEGWGRLAFQAAVGKQDLASAARRLDRRIHAGAARSDHEHVGLDMHGLDHGLPIGVTCCISDMEFQSSISFCGFFSLPGFGEG